MLGHQAFEIFKKLPWNHCLDIGSGPGSHARGFRDAGKQVLTIDSNKHHNPDVVAAWPDSIFQPIFDTAKIDAIWACHVLEHSICPHDFLAECYIRLPEGGYLAVTVPPLKHQIVGGHLSLWNEGLLCYNLILAGFDLREARVGVYGYNISVIVQRTVNYALLSDVRTLRRDSGDVDKLAKWFPCEFHDGADGRFGNKRWNLE